MADPDARLELEYHRPAARADVATHVGRVLALGYVGLCVIGLIVMGVVMAARL